MILSIAAVLTIAGTGSSGDLRYLQSLARDVVTASLVAPEAEIAGVGKNTTGYTLRVPGGTQSYYPAFWVRDAAMMLGDDLVPADEVSGWIRVVAATQPGPVGLTFDHGLIVPPYSIPDHITLGGAACWYPGAYAEQGNGSYGFLPPADDAFYFVQMVNEAFRLQGKSRLSVVVRTAGGDKTAIEVCEKAFGSVATDTSTGLVECDETPGHTRVDWGFCDSIRKTGRCLMPSLLRWQAARRLSTMMNALGRSPDASRYRAVAETIRTNIVPTFYRRISDSQGILMSATGAGRKDDVWASAFAVWLGVLPRNVEHAVSRELLALYRSGETVTEGQVRQLPPTGEFGGAWDQAGSGLGTYQNGGYWATPTGWFVIALRKVDRGAADRMLHEFVESVRRERGKGAPFEWINPGTGTYQNGNYGSSAGLVYLSLTTH